MVQVATNGILSFGVPFYNAEPYAFPSDFSDIASLYLIAPFWSDVDIRREGSVFYEVHTTENAASEDLLGDVSAFVSNYTGNDFQGSWMLIAQWDEVHPFPAGSPFAEFLSIFYGDLNAVSVL